MKNYLVLHGHFYQPPREDPWSGLLPYQESATPYHDWNRRITRECYAANAASRFLRYDGRIEDIINNYEVLSFNFGTTLIKWLESNAPHVYEAILEADRRSMQKNNGHGNAIAQSYNHTILPLDTPEDARLQVRWGLEDFRSRFGRNSEGMWLPETAVNEDILDILIDEGIRYVILSPWQAESIKADAGKKEFDLENEPVPWWRPYRIDRPRGSIAVFFYNHELAAGISFDHYLRSADSLYTRLLKHHNNADPGHIIHAATDGEVYGHHEPYGDMCLAALRIHAERGNKFVFTNYAAYLDEHPPVYSVKLKKGEDELGSSWSCVHGVSRWFKDCGCSTGGKEGWNQKWRTPLREGFQALSRSLREIYRDRVSKLSSIDPETILDRYASVLSGTVSRDDFAAEVLDKGVAVRKKGNAGRRQDKSEQGEADTRRKEENSDIEAIQKEREELFTLLEANLYRMYMFTSCGWFFAELSGLEPVQNIRYALKAINLLSEYTDEDLHETLRSYLVKAKSNITSFGNGAEIMKQLEAERLPEGVEAATYFFLKPFFTDEPSEEQYYGFFELQKFHTEEKGESYVRTFIVLRDTSIEKSFSFRFTGKEEERDGLNIFVDDLTDDREPFQLELSKLPTELRNKIGDFLIRSTQRSFSEIAASLFDEVKEAVTRTAEMATTPPSIIMHTAEISLNSLIFSHLPDAEQYPTEESAAELERLFGFAANYGINLETELIRTSLADYIWSVTERYSTGACEAQCDILIRILNAFRLGGIEPDSTILQKVIYSHVQRWRTRIGLPQRISFSDIESSIPIQQVTAPTEDERDELNRVIRMGDAIGIYTDDIKHRVSELV